nr:hypothetical protein [Tanacetum cinerariifolium]
MSSTPPEPGMESSTIMSLAYALEKEGVTAFRFDFAGNGYRVTRAILGHSKGILPYAFLRFAVALFSYYLTGGNVVLLYASKYLDVHRVINVYWRYKTEGGVEESLRKGYLQKVKEDGFIDVKSRTGGILEAMLESLMVTQGEFSVAHSNQQDHSRLWWCIAAVDEEIMSSGFDISRFACLI